MRAFHDLGVDTIDDVVVLDREDLEEVNVFKPIHIKKIMAKISVEKSNHSVFKSDEEEDFAEEVDFGILSSLKILLEVVRLRNFWLTGLLLASLQMQHLG